MATFTLVQGEAKTITFTVTDSDGSAVDLSSATLSLAARPAPDDADVFTKANGDFDKTLAASGIVSVEFSATDLDRNGTYFVLLAIQFSASNIDHSIHTMALSEWA